MVYAKCTEVVAWFGEYGPELEECKQFKLEDGSAGSGDGEHEDTCFCRNGAWEETLRQEKETEHDLTPKQMIKIGVPVLLRLGCAKTCSDLRMCQLFRTTDEMLAFRYLMSTPLGMNPWFKRIWTLQECLLAPSNTIYLGAVSFPFEAIYQAARIMDEHLTWSCCEHLTDMIPYVRSVLKSTMLLNLSRNTIQQGQQTDLFHLRTGFLGRHATLDVDHLYGILGLAREMYSIVPDYTQSTEAVYIFASQKFLQSAAPHDTFWIFIYTNAKNRYPTLPSWVIDWTCFELDDAKNSRQNWAGMIAKFEHSRARSNVSPPPTFSGTTMYIRGSRIDTISSVGAAMSVPASLENIDAVMFMLEVLDSWRAIILSADQADSAYTVPSFYPAVTYDWATAWVRLLSWGHSIQPGRGTNLLTDEEIETVRQDARRDPLGWLLLDHGELDAEEEGDGMENQQLYSQVKLTTILNISEKKFVLTGEGYAGFANMDVKEGDEVWRVEGCNSPLVLRPDDFGDEEGSQGYRIVSPCYMEGFMSGPVEDAGKADQLIGII